mmetsp:Transcript_11067/g.18894  ORF Transcript_11067/g.18894 Transcript_11067/m.18894 type:complete len:261 (-) Transcript_11067:75-857(-)
MLGLLSSGWPQAALAVVGSVLAVHALLVFDGLSCFGGGFCVEHWGLWMSAPACFWSGFGAFCMRTRRKELQAVALELQCVVALSSLAAMLLLMWQTAAMGGFRHLALSLVLQAQVATSVWGACQARRTRDGSGFVGGAVDGTKRSGRRSKPAEPKASSLPRGWRFCEDLQGRPFFEHKQTGRIQWDLPGSEVCASAAPEEEQYHRPRTTTSSLDEPKSPRIPLHQQQESRARSKPHSRERPDLRALFEAEQQVAEPSKRL